MTMSSLSLGVALTDGALVVACSRRTRPTTQAVFPASSMGAEVIRVFLDHCSEPIRLAVTAAELDFALQWTSGPMRETFVVSSRVRPDALALADYAAHAL